MTFDALPPFCRVEGHVDVSRANLPSIYAVAVADAFSRITGGSRIGVCTFQGGVNAAGRLYAYAGMAQASEDGSPVLCITDGVPAGSSGNSQYGMTQTCRRTLGRDRGPDLMLSTTEMTPPFRDRKFA